MKHARTGMALPAALAAIIILAGVAALANISATAAIRESHALRDVAAGRMQMETLRARAMYQISRRARSELIGATLALGITDTSLTVTALTWPWHTLSVTTGGTQVFAEFARATVPFVMWCSAAVYAGAADIGAGTMAVAPPATCADRTDTDAQVVASFDSTLVSDLVGIGNADTLTIVGSVTGVVRSTRVISVAGGAIVTGVVIAPVVRILGGASVRGLVVARDSLVVAGGADVTGDADAVIAVLRDRARLIPVGRRGLVLVP